MEQGCDLGRGRGGADGAAETVPTGASAGMSVWASVCAHTSKNWSTVSPFMGAAPTKTATRLCMRSHTDDLTCLFGSKRAFESDRWVQSDARSVSAR